MAASGNEVARLGQLKGLYPQVVRFTGNSRGTIMLRNGKSVTFSCPTGGNKHIYLLVKVMYNSFELLQAVTDDFNVSISVSSHYSMMTFGAKMQGGEEGKIYMTSNESLKALDIYTGNEFNFTISNNLTVFVGALIYVS